MRSVDAVEPIQVRLETKRSAGVDAKGLERGAASQERLVICADDRLVRSAEAPPGDGDREHAHRVRFHAARSDRVEKRASLDPGLLDLRRGIRVPHDPSTHPEVDATIRDRERADGEREVEVAVPVHASERTHRGTATDRLELCDEIHRRDLRRARDRSPWEHRPEQLRKPHVVSKRSLDDRDHVLDSSELARDHELGPMHGSRPTDAREVVSLEVDDHHVLGGILLGASKIRSSAERARALDRHRPDSLSAAGEKELRRAGGDGPAVTDVRRRVVRAEWRKRRGK